jgi:hypothetical protein
MTIIFVGKSDIVENFYDEVSAKNEEIQENLKRKNRIESLSYERYSEQIHPMLLLLYSSKI